MQTHFTLAQLADPDHRRSESILRNCVHCGFCTATCPTYVLLGDELDSPRGRIYLIKDMLEERPAGDGAGGQARRPLPVLSRLHDDLSVGRALHASGRPGARAYRKDLPAAFARPGDRAPSSRCMLPYPRRFRLALVAGALARPFADASCPAASARCWRWRRRRVPAPLAAVDGPRVIAAEGPRNGRASRC